jgi:DegV family protein with EDD domain
MNDKFGGLKMQKFKIVTDSCVDLTAEMAKALDLVVLPLSVTIEEKSYRNYLDEREIKFKDFYQMLRDKKTATTSQVNPENYITAIEPFLEEGYDILLVTFSSALSGTYQASLIAKSELLEKYPHGKILIIDSLCASMGQGLLLKYLADMKQQNASLEELVLWAEKNKQRMCHLFTVGDLNHLRRGGRLSYAKAFLGTLLKIKPLLHVDMGGRLVQTGAVRGRRQALNKMVERMVQTIENPEEQEIFISHGDCLDDVIYVIDRIHEFMKVKNIVFNYVGPVIGSHSGIDTLAIFYLGNDRFTPYNK